MKGPTSLVVGIICFLVGLVVGGLGVYVVGPLLPAMPAAQGQFNPTAPVPMMGGGPPPGGGAARSKTQLGTLVTKLDQLTQKPLSITLTDDERAKLRDQLAGLEAMDELTDDEAKKRLDAILNMVQDEKEMLIAAGYEWPGSGGGSLSGGPPPVPANPFKEGEIANHLKALRERLGKGKPD